MNDERPQPVGTADADADMGEIHRRINRNLALVFGAFTVGLLIVLSGVVIFDSRRVVGFALAWLTGVVMYAWLTFRCPLCRAAVFNSPALAAFTWILHQPRRCPRCNTEFEAALREVRSNASIA